YNLRRRAAAAGEEYEAGEYRALKAAFMRHRTWGAMIGTYSCGIIAGVATLHHS
ncbi:unnamed protein product, partial [Ascophyllum nodosum]